MPDPSGPISPGPICWYASPSTSPSAPTCPGWAILTFPDTIPIIACVVTALAVIFNVALKRLEAEGKTDLTQKIDTCLLWGYLISYAVGMILLILVFFL